MGTDSTRSGNVTGDDHPGGGGGWRRSAAWRRTAATAGRVPAARDVAIHHSAAAAGLCVNARLAVAPLERETDHGARGPPREQAEAGPSAFAPLGELAPSV